MYFRCPNISGSISACCHVGLLLLVGSCPWYLTKNTNKPVQIVTIKNKFLSILHPDEAVQTSSNKRVHQLYNCKERTSENKRKNCHFFNPSQLLSQFDRSSIYSKSDSSSNTGTIYSMSDTSSNTETIYSMSDTSSNTTDNETNNDSIEETSVFSNKNNYSISSQSVSMSANKISSSEATVTYISQESLSQPETKDNQRIETPTVETQESGRHQTLPVESEVPVSNITDADTISVTSSQTSYYGRSGVDTSKNKFKKKVLDIPPKSRILGK